MVDYTSLGSHILPSELLIVSRRVLEFGSLRMWITVRGDEVNTVKAKMNHLPKTTCMRDCCNLLCSTCQWRRVRVNGEITVRARSSHHVYIACSRDCGGGARDWNKCRGSICVRTIKVHDLTSWRHGRLSRATQHQITHGVGGASDQGFLTVGALSLRALANKTEKKCT